MQIIKKTFSVILAIVIMLSLLPTATFASEAGTVYITISEEGRFISDPSENPMAHRAVSLQALKTVDLCEYGLGDYQYDADNDGDYDLTALHLYIYVHEKVLGLRFADVDTSAGAPASMYFSENLFGFEDENLRYDYNGSYPADENGWGLTADRIVLSDGDYFDVAHYSDWQFYNDSAYGFHYFANADGTITHAFTAEAGIKMNAKLILVSGGLGAASIANSESDYIVYFGQTFGSAEGAVKTDSAGIAAITFPSAGTWYIWCNGGKGVDKCPDSIVSSPAAAAVTVKATETATDPFAVLNAIMAQLAATVPEPSFGTNAGEWTVLCLARGGYYEKDHTYFAGYYDRIVETVNTTAAKVNLNGALHKQKSTDNSRLIVALSAIGKNATSVGDWDLTAPYSDFAWVKKQGINGVVWALIALDSNNYATTDPTIRRQCIDYILAAELAEGGWALAGQNLDVDITGMVLQSLYPYRGQAEVSAAAERAFTRLSNAQLENGGFRYGSVETSESAAQVIVACTVWGIHPDTDSRFIKNGNSVVDNLLTYYVEDAAMFAHQGNLPNNMATDQACYALIAYSRLLKGQPSLYDCSDVHFDGELSDTDTITATVTLPAQIAPNAAFNGIVSISKWDNEAGYKLIDFILNVPDGVTVTDVTASNRLNGGEVVWNLEAETGKLRVVYFDANANTTLTVTGESFPTELFTIGFQAERVSAGSNLEIALSGMSLKLTSDSEDDASMVVVNTDTASATTNVVAGISFSAKCLYIGDDVDIIPSTKKAVAVAITGIAKGAKLTFKDGENEIIFQYSKEITNKSGVPTYIALVDAEIDMAEFIDEKNFTIGAVSEEDAITFGDVNGDGVVNAQDALAAVDTWLRRGEEPTDIQMMSMNVNGDSRINTYDALGIVEAFVNKIDYIVVAKAATIANEP